MTLTVINVSVDGKETWERALTGWYYSCLPAGDSVSVHLPFYIWLSVQNLFISVNPTSIFFQMGSNFCRLEHGLPVNIYSHRKPLLECISSQMYVLLFLFVHVLPLDMVRSSSSVRPILETHEIWNLLQHPSGSLSLFFSIYTIGILFNVLPRKRMHIRTTKMQQNHFFFVFIVCALSHMPSGTETLVLSQ